MEKDVLQQEINKIFEGFQTKPILFIGSGISKRYLGLPDWESLLTMYADKINSTRFPYRIYDRKALKEISKNNLEEFEKLPIVASLIKEEYEDRFFDDNNFEKDIKEKFDDEIRNGKSPFKLSLSHYFKMAIPKTISYDLEKDSFIKLVNKVSNIVTTNYDEFLESQFENYNVCVGQNDILNKRLNRIGNIFKIHGSSSDPDSLVITKDDYDFFGSKQKFLTAKLLTFFMEYPTIFMGYGAGDNNIISIFKDIKDCLNPEGEVELSKKLLFIEFTDDENSQEIVNIEIAGLRMTKIILKDYNILYSAFDKIIEAIDIEYLKVIEDKIVQLIQTTDKKVNRVYADSLENHDFSSDEMAILVGHSSSVFRYGYESISMINICEDILFHQKNYDAKGIIDKSILSQKGRFSHSKLPLYKYLNKYEGTLDPYYTDERCVKIISRIDDIYNTADKLTILYKKPKKTINDLIVEDLNKSVRNIYLCLKVLDINEVKKYIISIWDKRSMLKGYTYLTKIICAIDLCENKKNE